MNELPKHIVIAWLGIAMVALVAASAYGFKRRHKWLNVVLGGYGILLVALFLRGVLIDDGG